MSLPPQAVERIRSLTDQDAIFHAFDSYPWAKDKTFMSGLFALLGNPNGQPAQGSSPRDMATHARIFYYAQRLGVTIDFTAYQTWLSQHPDHQAPDILPDSYLARHSDSRSQDAAAAAESSASLPWQQAAPKNDLFIDKKAAAAGQSQEDQPSYPMAFAEMLKLLQEGKPVPGIRQIPNTVVRDPSIKPVGSRTVPRKPWERDNSSSLTDNPVIPKALDIEFPPVEAEAESLNQQQSTTS
ncbi:hypothetical protein V2G26_016135 [Clonostachys chloroleuca]|uniref:Uncharacterized protein n=1 Tax=Clonostachys chloroleuca TaxID=1926264 RepID=A0AA35Q909_9HYPO|nr:unnamed protein product [Clonostachys chloroleuca]